MKNKFTYIFMIMCITVFSNNVLSDRYDSDMDNDGINDRYDSDMDNDGIN